MPEYEAGEWPVDYALAACTVFDQLEDNGDLREACENVAVNILWNFTNRFFSTREVIIRPIRRTSRRVQPPTFEGRGPLVPYPAGRLLGWLPVMIEGQWYNLRCGSCGASCGCKAPWSIELPGAQSVVSVQIGTETLDPSEYRLDQSRLIRKEGSWPLEQNIRRDIGEEGTWAVRYVRGEPVPLGGQTAAGILACELGKAALNDSSCKLPSRVQTVTRQDVTMTILDTMEDLAKGRTGIPEVDRWTVSVNVPRSAARPAISPDYRGHWV